MRDVSRLPWLLLGVMACTREEAIALPEPGDGFAMRLLALQSVGSLAVHVVADTVDAPRALALPPLMAGAALYYREGFEALSLAPGEVPPARGLPNRQLPPFAKAYVGSLESNGWFEVMEMPPWLAAYRIDGAPPATAACPEISFTRAPAPRDVTLLLGVEGGTVLVGTAMGALHELHGVTLDPQPALTSTRAFTGMA